MPLFMTQAAYTPEAWAALTKTPEPRVDTIREWLEQLGGRMVNLYFSFGEYDAVLIYEAPDADTAAAVAISALSAGHLKASRTTRLLTPDEAVQVMRKAATATLQPPT